MGHIKILDKCNNIFKTNQHISSKPLPKSGGPANPESMLNGLHNSTRGLLWFGESLHVHRLCHFNIFYTISMISPSYACQSSSNQIGLPCERISRRPVGRVGTRPVCLLCSFSLQGPTRVLCAGLPLEIFCTPDHTSVRRGEKQVLCLYQNMYACHIRTCEYLIVYITPSRFISEAWLWTASPDLGPWIESMFQCWIWECWMVSHVLEGLA